MKTRIILLLCAIATCIALQSCSGCSHESKKSRQERIFEGSHKLRRFSTRENNVSESHSSGGFFLFMGGYSSSSNSYSEITVKFALLDNEGNYVLSELSYDKIRVHIDSTVTTPYVKFNWHTYPCYGFDLMCSINYMVVYCREEDFPSAIDINSL